MIDLEAVPFENVQSLSEIDVLLTAVGYESRASHLSKILDFNKVKTRYCFQLVTNCNEVEKRWFQQHDFTFITLDTFLDDILNGHISNVVIDYSVMMKSIYADIIRKISKSPHLQNTNFYFSYSQSIYEDVVKTDTQIKSIRRILTTGDKLMTVPKNGYKLVISLGHERLSAIGVIENLEIAYEDVYILINKESDDAPYYKECIRSNKEFLSLLQPNQIIEIDFFNFAQTITVLDSLYYKFSRIGSHVILAPMSVKPFSLLSMVHSLRYTNVFFYNVTSVVTKSNGTKLPDNRIKPKVYLAKSDGVDLDIF